MKRYEIQVVGHIEPRRARALGCGAPLPLEDGGCLLGFDAVDQAALYGLLTRLRDLGVELVALRRTSNEAASDRQED
jgi:hypothetical protein